MRYLGIGLVYAWRYTLGLLTPASTCKYHPGCSQYAIDAFRTHGLLKGGVRNASIAYCEQLGWYLHVPAGVSRPSV